MTRFLVKWNLLISVLSLIVVLFYLMSLQACGVDETDNETVTLTLWMHQGAEIELLPEVIESFKSSHPGVEVEIIRPPEYDYFHFLIASSRTGSLPDVFDVDAPNIAYMVHINSLLPFEDVDGMTGEFLDSIKQEFYPAIIDQGTVNNKLYTLGSYNASTGIYYNKQLVTDALLAQAGVTHIPTCSKDSWTWDEFEQVLSAFATANPDKYGMLMDFDMTVGDANELLTFFYLPVIYSNGQEIIDETSMRMRQYLDAQGSIEALERFSIFIHKDENNIFMEDTSISGAAEEYLKEFKEGQAAFCLHGHWKYNELKGTWNGQTWEGGLGDDLGIMPLPRFGAYPPHSPTGSYSWAISSRTLHSNLAMEMILHLTSSATQKIFIEGIDDKAGSGAIPTKESARLIISPYSDCVDQNCGELCPGELTDDRCIFLEQTRCTAKVRPVTPAYNAFTSNFANVIREIARDPSADISTLLTNTAIAHDDEFDRLQR